MSGPLRGGDFFWLTLYVTAIHIGVNLLKIVGGGLSNRQNGEVVSGTPEKIFDFVLPKNVELLCILDSGLEQGDIVHQQYV